LSPRSRKLFTLSSIYTATSALLSGIDGPEKDLAAFATEFREAVWKQFPEWEQVRQRRMPAGEVRAEFIHSHAVALHALARVGNHFAKAQKKGWKQLLTRISSIDWSRRNTQLWEGRAMLGGRVSKAGNSVTLVSAVLKSRIGLPLSPE